MLNCFTPSFVVGQHKYSYLDLKQTGALLILQKSIEQKKIVSLLKVVLSLRSCKPNFVLEVFPRGFVSSVLLRWFSLVVWSLVCVVGLGFLGGTGWQWCMLHGFVWVIFTLVLFRQKPCIWSFSSSPILVLSLLQLSHCNLLSVGHLVQQLLPGPKRLHKAGCIKF